MAVDEEVFNDDSSVSIDLRDSRVLADAFFLRVAFFFGAAFFAAFFFGAVFLVTFFLAAFFLATFFLATFFFAGAFFFATFFEAGFFFTVAFTEERPAVFFRTAEALFPVFAERLFPDPLVGISVPLRSHQEL